MKERDVPVVWSSNTVPDLEEYQEKGHLKRETFYDPQHIEIIRNEVYTLRETTFGEHLVLESGSATVRSIYGLHVLHPELVTALLPPAAVELAESILGPGVYVSQSRINFKSAHSGGGYFWHSDFTIWNWEDGLMLPRCISFMIPLAEMGLDNGPLKVVAGSHYHYDEISKDSEVQARESEYTYKEYGRDVKGRCLSTPDQMKLIETLPTDTILGGPGDLFCFDSNLLHASDPNFSSRDRPVVFIVINSLHNKLQDPLSGEPPRADWVTSRDYTCLTTH